MAEKIVFEVDLDAPRIAQELARITKASNDLKQERRELDKALKENKISEDQYTDAIAQNTLATQRLSKQRQDNTRQLKAVQQATDSATGSLNQQRAVLRLLQNQFDNLTDREGKNREEAERLRKRIDQLNETVLNAEKSTGRAQRQVGFYEKALQRGAGSINLFGQNLGTVLTDLNEFKEALIAQRAATAASTAATGGASKALNVFKIALISTGIGAIVVAIGALAAGFLSTQKGIDAALRVLRPFQVGMQRLLGIVQDVALSLESPEQALRSLGDFIVSRFTNQIENIVQLFQKLGAAGNALVNRDWKALGAAVVDINKEFVDLATGGQDVVDSFTDFASETNSIAQRLEDLRKQIILTKRENTTLIESLRAQAEEQRTIAQNVTLTDAERTKAAKNALNLLQQIEDAQLNLIDAQIEEQKLINEQNDTLDSENQKLAELEAERDRIIRERITQQREVNNQLNTLVKENTKAETDALNEVQEIRRRIDLMQIEDEEEKQKRLLEIQLEGERQRIALLKASEETKNAILLELEREYQLQLQQIRDKAREDELTAAEQDRLAAIEIGQKRILAQKELDVLEAENIRERNEALLALQVEQQRQELENFKGTEEEKLLLEKQQTQARIDLANDLRDAQINSNLAIAKSYSSMFSSIAGLTKENAALQKAAALFDIGVNLATAIAQSVQNATQSAGATGPAAVFTQPGFVATLIGQVTAAIGQARAVLSNTQFEDGGIVKFAQGGNLAYEGGYIPELGGMIRGRSHANGGVRFAMGGGIGEAQGGEAYVVNISGNPMLRELASRINVAGGGKPFKYGGIAKYQDGGITTTQRNNLFSQEIMDLVRSQPIVVTVEDINAGQSRTAQVVNRANL